MSVRIEHRDCLEGLVDLDAESVDVVVTSPPYNIGVAYNEYVDDKPFDEYLSWIFDVAEELYRVLSDDGSFFLNIGDKPSDEFRAFKVAETVGKIFELQNTIHWVKHISVPEENVNMGHFKPINSHRYINDCHEYIFHFTKSGDTEVDKLANGTEFVDKRNVQRYGEDGLDKRDRGNIWFIPYETVSDSKSHPAAFPIKLPEMSIKLHGVDKTDRVLDPFAGIGTTLVASERLGIDGIGFEIDEEYIRKARERF